MADQIRFFRKFTACLTLSFLFMGTTLLIGTPPRHSHVFGCIIGLIQITGAFLLFFRRTRFAATLLLFPVMLNILLINVFYQMNAGALLQSILLTLGLIYILFQEYPALRSLLFPARPSSIGLTLRKIK